MTMEPIKVAIWGIGKEFNQLWPKILLEAEKGNIKILAFVDTNQSGNTLHNINIVAPKDVYSIDIDYLIVSTSVFFFDIYELLLLNNFSESKIVDASLFDIEDFDFIEFIEKGYIRKRIFGNQFKDMTMLNRKRTYECKNVSIVLGNKSYVAGSILEGCIDGSESKIMVGNYSCISWNTNFEIGLNQDHDYRRVFNYGLTHFGWDYSTVFPTYRNGGDDIEIGSDVWIGKNVSIKTGVKIGNGAVVAANSVVVCDVPDYAIVGGNPARLIKFRFEKEIINELQSIKWWDWDVRLIEDRFKDFITVEGFVLKYYHKNEV